MTTISTINGYKILPSQVTCSDLGLTLTDVKYDNLNKLINGICKYGTIYVDKNYRINCGSKTISALSQSQWYLTTNSFELIGLNEGCGFTFAWEDGHTPGTDFYLFELNSCLNEIINTIKLDNLSFKVDYATEASSSKPLNVYKDGTFQFYSESELEKFINCDTSLGVKVQNDSELHFTCCESAWDYVNNSQAIKPLAGSDRGTQKYYDHTHVSRCPTFDEICEYTSGTQLRYKLQYFTKLFNATKNAPVLNRLVLFNKTNNPTADFTIKHFSITNCSFYGNIRLVNFSRSTAPALYVKQGVINNNEVLNVRTSAVALGNVSTDYFEVKNNLVKNFDTVFFNWTVGEIDKDQYTGPKIAQTAKLIVIENNTVDNDDNWYHNQYAATSYYCFALCECDRVIYRKNSVKGMKSFHPYRIQPSTLGDKIVRVNLALYDAYLSCRNVLSELNHWENNVLLFYYDNNTLLKAKDSQTEATQVQVWNATTNSFDTKVLPPAPGERKYYNNTYISTEEFLRKHLYHYWSWQIQDNPAEVNERVEQQLQVPYVHFMSNVSISNWDIQGNTFDIYNLAGGTGTGSSANNTITLLPCSYVSYNNSTATYPLTQRFLAYDNAASDGEEASVYYELKIDKKNANEDSVWPVKYEGEKTFIPYLLRQVRKDDGTDAGSKSMNTFTTWKKQVDKTFAPVPLLEHKDLEETRGTLPEFDWKETNNDTAYYYFSLSPEDSEYHYFIVLMKELPVDKTINDMLKSQDNFYPVNYKNHNYFKLGVIGLDYIFNFGYYVKRLIFKNNVINAKYMKYSLLSTQRQDAEVICEDNTLIVNCAPKVTNGNKPKLYSGAIAVEPVGYVKINNNTIRGFSSVLASPNIKFCELNNNRIELAKHVSSSTGNDIIPYIIEYNSADTEKLKEVEYNHRNFNLEEANYTLIEQLYGANNKIITPASTYLPVKESNIELQFLSSPAQTQFYKTKWKDKTIPNCSILAEGSTKFETNGVLSPSVFEGIKYFDNISYNYGISYVDQLLPISGGTISINDKDNHIQYAKFTIATLKEAE